MGALRIIGVVLIVLGIIGLIYGGITYSTHKNVANVGPLQLQMEEKKSIPLSPVLSGAVLVLGVIFILAGARRSASDPPA